MEPEDWAERWATGRTPWHRSSVHPDLVARADTFLGDAPCRVLVPLCGKTRDISWLASRGHHVVGVEVVEQGIRELCAEQGIEAAVTDENGARVYRAPNIELYVADLFDLTADQMGRIDCIWDRASMVALAPPLWQRYGRTLRQLSGPGTRLLLSTVSYDTSVMSGPPFSIAVEDVEATYDGCEIEVLRREDVIAEADNWREKGHQWWISSLYAIAW